MAAKPIHVVTNIAEMARLPSCDAAVRVEVAQPDDSWSGARALLRQVRGADVLLLSVDARFLQRLCLLRALSPRRRPKLIAVDLLLNRPDSPRQRLLAFLQRIAFRQVSRFVHYFADLQGYRRYFGIGPDRSSYVPFKCNLWETARKTEPSPDGDYVLAAGRSLRDYPTFLDAIRRTDLPAKIVLPGDELLRMHGSLFDKHDLPPNVELAYEDGSMQTWARYLREARFVVIPIQPAAIRSCGISMCLDAMCLGKPVVLTEGPTTRGVFQDEVLTVPPADSGSLARAIADLWTNPSLRRRLAEASIRHASIVQGKDRLYKDLVTLACHVSQSKLAAGT